MHACTQVYNRTQYNEGKKNVGQEKPPQCTIQKNEEIEREKKIFIDSIFFFFYLCNEKEKEEETREQARHSLHRQRVFRRRATD